MIKDELGVFLNSGSLLPESGSITKYSTEIGINNLQRNKSKGESTLKHTTSILCAAVPHPFFSVLLDK